MLYVDLLCLDNSGNLLDTSVIAMTSALETLETLETKQIQVSRTGRSKLKLNSLPLSSTVVTVSSLDNITPFVLSDPTEEEEQLSNSQVTVVTVEDDVCHLVNPGGDLLTTTIIQNKKICEKVKNCHERCCAYNYSNNYQSFQKLCKNRGVNGSVRVAGQGPQPEADSLPVGAYQ